MRYPEKLTPGRAETPVILQMEATECGAAALGMILAYYGREVSLEELREACGISRDGSNAAKLKKAAESYGLDVTALFLKPEEVLRGKFPALIFWEGNHFLTLEGVKKDIVFLNDPAVGPRTVSREEFNQSFSALCMLMEPNKNFKRKKRNRSVLKKLLPELKGSPQVLAFIFMVSVAMTLPGLVSAGLAKVFIDDYLIREECNWIYPIATALFVAAFLQVTLYWLRKNCQIKLAGKLSVAGSYKFMWRLLRLPMEFFAMRSPGDVLARLKSVDGIAGLLSGELTDAMLNLVQTFLFGVFMILMSWPLALLALIDVFANIIVYYFLRRKRIDLNYRVQTSNGRLLGATMSGAQMIDNIKATGSEDDFFCRWAGLQAKYINSAQRLGFWNIASTLFPRIGFHFSAALILGVGCYLVIRGELTLGGLIAFTMLKVFFAQPLSNLVRFSSQFQKAEVELARLEDVESHKTDNVYALEEDEESPPDSSQALSGHIEFKNVTFGYNKTAPPVIEGFSFELKPGARIAVVGPSGCGKSTIVRLAANLFHPWSGEILYDGVPIDQISRKVIASSVSVVEQAPCFFEGSLRNNLTMWDSSVADEKIKQALTDACVIDDISARKGSLDCAVTEGGSNFSGGQKQRLEIARALLNDPSILILDEATSAMDAEEEHQVDMNLRKRKCSCLVSAHRLSSVRDCDQILVIEQGRIKESGSHEELINKKGAYFDLLNAGQQG